MATIKEVAKKAKVSVGTVSNVINGLETVSEKNREKVLKVIKRLGYKHNKIAASLISKKTSNIGLIVPDVSSPFYADLIKGIYEDLEEKGYNVFLAGSSDDLKKEEKIIGDLLSSWIDGIILIPVYDSKRDISYINDIEVPIVMVNREVLGVERDLVVFNNFGGALKATDFLIENKNEKIVILAGPKYSRSFQNRFLGCKEALEGKSLYMAEYVFNGDYSAESGYRCMMEALKRLKEIDAVFALSDLLAFGAIKAISGQGLSIPDDISIIGFGDIYLSKYLNPPLTAVKRPFRKIGNAAAELLLKRISGETHDFPRRVVIEGELEIRGTVKMGGENSEG